MSHEEFNPKLVLEIARACASTIIDQREERDLGPAEMLTVASHVFCYVAAYVQWATDTHDTESAIGLMAEIARSRVPHYLEALNAQEKEEKGNVH